MGETANPIETAAGAIAPAAVSRETIKRAVPEVLPPVDIYLIETEDYSTVHGERSTSDPDYALCFIQRGLPFDAEKKLLRKHATAKTEKALATIAKLEARARKLLARKSEAAVEEDDDDEPVIEDDGEGVIDLKAWARGEKKYRWQLVTDTIVLKFAKRCSSKRDALETLIAEGVVQPGQLSAEHKNALGRL